MLPPIFVFEGDNVEAFPSVTEAAPYLEAIVVKNGTYEAYDASGVQRDLSTATIARSRHGLLDHLFRLKQPERVVIFFVAEKHLDHICGIWSRHYNKRPHSSRDHLPPDEATTVQVNEIKCTSKLSGVVHSSSRRAA